MIYSIFLIMTGLYFYLHHYLSRKEMLITFAFRHRLPHEMDMLGSSYYYQEYRYYYDDYFQLRMRQCTFN